MNKLIGVLGLIAVLVIGIFAIETDSKESAELKNAYMRAMASIVEKNHSKILLENYISYKNKNNNIAGCIHVDDRVLKKQRTFKFIVYKNNDKIEISEIPCELSM